MEINDKPAYDQHDWVSDYEVYYDCRIEDIVSYTSKVFKNKI